MRYHEMAAVRHLRRQSGHADKARGFAATNERRYPAQSARRRWTTPERTHSLYPYPHELIASGKQGIVYVLNRDQMGMYQLNDGGKIQEFPLVPGATYDVQFGSPAYWNNTVYFAPNASPYLAYPLSGGLLGTPLKVGKYPGSHSPSISANGNTNGILWVIESGAQLLAFDAVSLKVVYTTNHGNPVLYTSSALRYHHHHRHRHQSSQPRRLYRNQPVVSSMCGRGRPRPRHRARRIQCHPAKPI